MVWFVTVDLDFVAREVCDSYPTQHKQEEGAAGPAKCMVGLISASGI